MNKIKAVWLVLKNHHYVIVTSKGHRACTPVFGHDEYWKNATKVFTAMKKYAQEQQNKKLEGKQLNG